MNYQTFSPHPDLEAFICCYWTLEVPSDPNVQKQRIVPDGCIEMAFVLGDDIKRYTSDEYYILQPRSMVIGQTIEPFYIEPTGNVNTFAVRFFPYGFANFVDVPIKALANKETPIEDLFGKERVQELTQSIIQASGTEERIEIIELFLRNKLKEPSTIDHIVKSTVDVLLASKGNVSINVLMKEDISKRRQLERKFAKQIGISPKQLSKVIRLQSALKLMLHDEKESLTYIAYESEYYDQAHFVKDFKEFTGTNPKDFLGNENMTLSSLFYKS